MNILALDAACGAAAACLIRGDGEITHAEGEEGKPHSQAILPLLEGLIKEGGVTWQQLDMLALGIGPGSFTGLRVAAASLAGINASLGLPMLPLSSLGVTAMQTGSDEAVWVIEDARAGEAFIGCYRQGKALQKDECTSWQSVESLTPARFAACSEPPVELQGWQRLEPVLERGEAMGRVVLAQLENVDEKRLSRYLQPAYLQISQAERSARRG